MLLRISLRAKQAVKFQLFYLMLCRKVLFSNIPFLTGRNMYGDNDTFFTHICSQNTNFVCNLKKFFFN